MNYSLLNCAVNPCFKQRTCACSCSLGEPSGEDTHGHSRRVPSSPCWTQPWHSSQVPRWNPGLSRVSWSCVYLLADYLQFIKDSKQSWASFEWLRDSCEHCWPRQITEKQSRQEGSQGGFFPFPVGIAGMPVKGNWNNKTPLLRIYCNVKRTLITVGSRTLCL